MLAAVGLLFSLFGIAVLLVTLLVSAAMLASAWRALRDALRAQRAPTVPIAGCVGGADVEIYGKIAWPLSTSLTAPLSSREVVFYEAQVSVKGAKRSKTVFSRSERVPFVVEDESGGRAVVHVENAAFYVCPAPESAAMLAGVRIQTGRADASGCTYSERTLAVGDPVYVLGEARVTAGGLPLAGAGYRENAGAERHLVFDVVHAFGGKPPLRPTLIGDARPTAMTPKLLREAATRFLLAAMVAGCGAAVGLGALSGPLDALLGR